MTQFAKLLHTYVLSGGGVTAVRTRDPMAAINEAIAFKIGQDQAVRVWDPARGWLQGTDPITDVGDGNTDLPQSIKHILAPNDSAEYPNKGLFVYTMIHHHLTPLRPNPELLQLLMIAAHNLPGAEHDRRILLCVPPSFTFPAELVELIPVIDHQAPDTDELASVIENVITDMAGISSTYIPQLTERNITRLAQASAGMIAPELENAFSRVIFSSVMERKTRTAEELRSALLLEKSDMVKRSRALEVMPAVSMDQVGGLGPLKAWLQTRVIAMDPEAWAAGVDKPKGCALVGPPGTGKSLCGKVIGSVLGVATIRFDISAVFSGLVGSSEENMRDALFMLESLAPCVVLLDEIDKVVSTGGGGDSGTSQKVLGAMLTFMQETEKAIFWVPTLNRTDNVPAEFLRAGRLDEVFGVAKPTDDERLQILLIHLKRRKVDVDSLGGLDQVVSAMRDFVGAEVEAVASAARLAAYNEGPEVEVTLDHLLSAAKGTKPLSRKMAAQFTAMEDWCKSNAVSANDEPRVTVAVRKRRVVGSPERMN
jgi:ATP-dependent 26S proteasome regulatory subunit